MLDLLTALFWPVVIVYRFLRSVVDSWDGY